MTTQLIIKVRRETNIAFLIILIPTIVLWKIILDQIHSLVQNSNLCFIFLVRNFKKIWKIPWYKMKRIINFIAPRYVVKVSLLLLLKRAFFPKSKYLHTKLYAIFSLIIFKRSLHWRTFVVLTLIIYWQNVTKLNICMSQKLMIWNQSQICIITLTRLMGCLVCKIVHKQSKIMSRDT